MASEPSSAPLSDLLLTTKDGDWGKDQPESGKVPYRVIRGADFPQARTGDVGEIPRCYLDAETVHRRTLKADDILIETAGGNRDRPTGRTLLVTQRLLDSLDLPATCASFARFLRVNPELASPGYIFWFLQWLYSRGSMWEHQVQHTGVARFQYTRFARTTLIPLPARPTQEAIACILGSLDEKIELNRKINQTQEVMAQAIFKSWFVDFDPVRARAAGQPPPGLDPEIANSFPESFEDSKLGKIPKGWNVTGLDALGTFLNGLAMQKYPPKDGYSLPVIKIAQLRKGSTDGADQASADLEKAYIVEDGDVLFSWSGSLECGIWTGGRGALNQHLFKVTSEHFPKWFYYLWIHHHLPWFRSIAAGKATTMGHIQRHHLVEAKVVVPKPTQLARLDSVIAPLLEAYISRNLECRFLTALRDALLPTLMSGELKVSNAERIVERCV